jgi:hypothetical protein
MSIGRRTSTDTRRRRVLAYQSSRDGEGGTSADRRLVEKLRQARRPVAIYGASVNRRLRGRWFSLVPVRRRAMAAASLAILGAAALLCLGHWLAISWQPLAYREAIARPLRLDRPDSFGTYVRAFLLAVAAGTSLLIYQLRRYRNDDYRGSYRIWPPVIILFGVASLDCVCGLIPWCGELIDLMLGKRIAMAGSDWIRIVMTIGGAALALRLVAEVRHSTLAFALLLLAVVCSAIPLAGRWGIMHIDTVFKWWLITSAPLMAAATLSVCCGAYLRMLFREVRRLDEDDRLSLRIRQWKANLLAARTVDASQPAEPRAAKKVAAEKTKPSKMTTPSTEPISSSGAAKTPSTDKPAEKSAAEKPAAGEPTVRKKRFAWLFRRRKQRAASSDTIDQKATAKSEPPPKPAVTQPSSAAKPATKATDESPGTAAEKTSTSGAPAKAARKRRSIGSVLFGWLRRSKSVSAGGSPSKAKAATAATSASRASSPSQSGDDDDDDIGDDSSIDWASMSKAERRRLRREIKRGDAA